MSKYVCERKSIIQRKYCSAKKIFIENLSNWSSLISHMRLFNFVKYYCVSEYVRCARVFEVFICASFWFRVRKKVAIKQNKKKCRTLTKHTWMSQHLMYLLQLAQTVCARLQKMRLYDFSHFLWSIYLLFFLCLSLYNVLFLIWVWFFVVWPPLHDRTNCRVSQLSNRTNEHLWEMPVLLTHTTWNTNALCFDCLFIVMEHTKRQTVSQSARFAVSCVRFFVVVFHSTLKSFSLFAQKYTHTACLAVVAMNCALL